MCFVRPTGGISDEEEGKLRPGLLYRWYPTMVPQCCAGIPGTTICKLSFSYCIIYSVLQLKLSTCLLALLDDVRFNTGHSFRFSQAHVLWSESTGYQWDYWHHILCVWNLYFIANHFWKQVKYSIVGLLSDSFCDMTPSNSIRSCVHQQAMAGLRA